MEKRDDNSESKCVVQKSKGIRTSGIRENQNGATKRTRKWNEEEKKIQKRIHTKSALNAQLICLDLKARVGLYHIYSGVLFVFALK